MPTIVAKIIHDDGSEQSFGPVTVSEEIASDISTSLQPVAELTEEKLATQREEELEEQARVRNEQAAAEQQRREDLAAAGIDPDGGEEN